MVSEQQSSDELVDVTVNGYSLLEFHKNLVIRQSIRPDELEVAEYLAGFLRDNGLEAELQEVTEGRYNVYSYYKQRDNKILLTSHIDTVPPFFNYSIEGSRIYGRGTCDAKGSVASQVFAYLSLLNDKAIVPGDVALLFVVGEETDGIGMRKASESLNTTWDVGIFGEPTELKLGVGHKGTLSLQLHVEGKASHSGYPELGISASEIIIPLLNDFLNIEYPVHELLGPTTLNIGKLDVGVAANVIPATADAVMFFRVSTDLQKLEQIVVDKLDGLEHVSYTLGFHSEPVYLDFEVPGFESIILAYATDIPNLKLKIPLRKRFLYGPGTIHVAHGADEFVESQDLLDAIDGYIRLVKHALTV